MANPFFSALKVCRKGPELGITCNCAMSFLIQQILLAALQFTRNASTIFFRAARKAGKRPPTSPMTSEKTSDL